MLSSGALRWVPQGSRAPRHPSLEGDSTLSVIPNPSSQGMQCRVTQDGVTAVKLNNCDVQILVMAKHFLLDWCSLLFVNSDSL